MSFVVYSISTNVRPILEQIRENNHLDVSKTLLQQQLTYSNLNKK